jgi:hypothetical protein
MAKMNTGQKIRGILPCSGLRQKDYGKAALLYLWLTHRDLPSDHPNKLSNTQ